MIRSQVRTPSPAFYHRDSEPATIAGKLKEQAFARSAPSPAFYHRDSEPATIAGKFIIKIRAYKHISPFLLPAESEAVGGNCGAGLAVYNNKKQTV